MGTITAGVVMMRWPLISALLMFLASMFRIKFRQSHSPALAVISTLTGISASCWFAATLLGLTTADFVTGWAAIKGWATNVIRYAPETWPVF